MTRAIVFLAVVLAPGRLPAQLNSNTGSVCWRAAPAPSCALVFVTNVGVYLTGGRHETVVATDPTTGAPTALAQRTSLFPRVTGDWGLLINMGPRNALGASLLGSLESRAFGSDAELAGFVMYRRWLGEAGSLDFGLGTPLILRNSGAHRAPYGLLRLNLTHQVSVALRPEIRRFTDYRLGTPRIRSPLFISAGAELGGKPGFFLSALGAVALAVKTLIDLRNSN